MLTPFKPGDAAVMETNEIRNLINDLQGRSETLRRYL